MWWNRHTESDVTTKPFILLCVEYFIFIRISFLYIYTYDGNIYRITFLSNSCRCTGDFELFSLIYITFWYILEPYKKYICYKMAVLVQLSDSQSSLTPCIYKLSLFIFLFSYVPNKTIVVFYKSWLGVCLFLLHGTNNK